MSSALARAVAHPRAARNTRAALSVEPAATMAPATPRRQRRTSIEFLSNASPGFVNAVFAFMAITGQVGENITLPLLSDSIVRTARHAARCKTRLGLVRAHALATCVWADAWGAACLDCVWAWVGTGVHARVVRADPSPFT